MEHERAQYQRSIREKQHDLRTKCKALNDQVRAQKQDQVRLEMEKQQLRKDMEELREELGKIKNNEKKLKAQLNEAQLKNSSILMNAMQQNQNMSAMGSHSAQSQLGYQNYLGRQRAGLITGKVGMQSKFMDVGKLNKD